MNKECVKGCGQRMKLLVSGREHSYGSHFFKCKCGAFEWLDEQKKLGDGAEACTSSTGGGGSLKLTLPGDQPMIVEGSVDDISELMKRLKTS